MSKKRFLIDSANVVHYSINCPLKVGSYRYEGEFDIVITERDEIVYGNKGELEPRHSTLCPSCTRSFTQRLIRRPAAIMSKNPQDTYSEAIVLHYKKKAEAISNKKSEQNLRDAFETAYLMLKENAEKAERENFYYDGFKEKRAIINVVSHYYKLSHKKAEDIYFEAVRQMDNEYREKHP